MENYKPSSRSRKFFGYAGLGMVLMGGAALPALGQSGGAAAVEGAAFLKQYCVTCHSQKLKTGGLSLETIDLGDVSRNGEILEKVVLKVGSGAMPPAAARRPDKAVSSAILDHTLQTETEENLSILYLQRRYSKTAQLFNPPNEGHVHVLTNPSADVNHSSMCALWGPESKSPWLPLPRSLGGENLISRIWDSPNRRWMPLAR